MSGGTIAAFVLYGGLLAGAFGALGEVYGDLLRAAGASERLGRIARGRSPISARPPSPVALPEPPRGELAFEDVTFHYPTRRETSALDGFSLAVRPRERLARGRPVGRRQDHHLPARRALLRPAGGPRADGRRRPHGRRPGRHPRSASPWCRRKPCCSPAPRATICATAIGTPTEEQLWQAARDANAEEFLRELPDGLDTHHGRRRRAPVGRPAPADRDRPRAAARRAAPAARRSDQRARRRKRAAGPGRARPADGPTARRSSSPTAWRPSAPPTGSS